MSEPKRTHLFSIDIRQCCSAENKTHYWARGTDLRVSRGTDFPVPFPGVAFCRDKIRPEHLENLVFIHVLREVPSTERDFLISAKFLSAHICQSECGKTRLTFTAIGSATKKAIAG